MLNKLFGKKHKQTEEHILAPVGGEVVAIEEVPDPTFSQKMMGDGVAIKPNEGKVVAPFDGEIMQLFPTKHAVGIKGKSGLEVLIHIGLETVSLDGEGFEGHVTAGDKVRAGDTLVTFDLGMIKEKAADTITPIVITNIDAAEALDKKINAAAKSGETEVMSVTVKS
ncbi:PTS system IIA component (Glc family) [Scopulibacillus darangshiensis]|uniref:PTS system IIA component (Glc family) n=1 Tax=Scopulibacillus darangshiensis TaxID=442528 RepID=A0A4R2NSB8_9BACL|nr:PTS glucose transporter subunit IIA [Scopulibacillus darangshiensis]TCP24849.1 PTS system IIA component (Glc family) [Scopulibacillus darangshiensis]